MSYASVLWKPRKYRFRYWNLFTLSLLFLGWGCQHNQFEPKQGETYEGIASYIIDGNTFYFSFDHGKFKVRIRGLETPDISAKGGFEAHEQLKKILSQRPIKATYIETQNGMWHADVELCEKQGSQLNLCKGVRDLMQAHP